MLRTWSGYWVTFLLMFFLLIGTAGCQAKDVTNSVKSSSVDGVTIKTLGTYNIKFDDSPAPVWSPSGNMFAYTVNVSRGIAELGTLKPFHVNQIHLGAKRHIVALTDHYAIVASSSDQEDWLYPLKNNAQLGQPKKWSAPTDTWQEWTVTQKGPSVLTGGYQKGTLSLTMGNGKMVSLSGGEAYLSLDHRFGAVLSRSRGRRAVNPSGGLEIPSRDQPGNIKDSITLWNFDAPNGPTQVTTINLSGKTLPNTMKNAYVGGMAFSPNDQEIAILISSESDGSQLTGQLDIFNVQSGKLIGTTSYGNGFVWLSGSRALWLNTPYAKGQGYDRIVNIDGKTLSRWKESEADMMIPINNQQIVLEKQGKTVGLAKPDGSFKAFPGIQNQGFENGVEISPGQKAALVAFDKEMCLIQY